MTRRSERENSLRERKQFLIVSYDERKLHNSEKVGRTNVFMNISIRSQFLCPRKKFIHNRAVEPRINRNWFLIRPSPLSTHNSLHINYLSALSQVPSRRLFSSGSPSIKSTLGEIFAKLFLWFLLLAAPKLLFAAFDVDL